MCRAFLCLISSLIFQVFVLQGSFAQESQVIDGYAWRRMEPETKIVYLKGLRGGMYLSMNTTFSLQYLFEENVRVKKAVLERMMIVNYIAVYLLLPQMESYGDIVELMDEIYDDDGNRAIPAYEIYRVSTIGSALASGGLTYKGQAIPFSEQVDPREWTQEVLSELRLRYGGGQ